MEQQLRKLGLSWNAVRVYVVLLKSGETTVGNVIKNVKAHRQSVYNALEELEERGFVVKTLKNKVNHYKLANPKIIVEKAKQQVGLAQKISQEILIEFKKGRHEHEITVYDGQEKIRNFFLDRNQTMKTGSTLYVISNYADKYEEVVETEFLHQQFNKKMRKKFLKVRIITGESKRQEFTALAKKLGDPKEVRHIKFIPDHIVLPNAVEIWEEGISFSSFEDECFVIEIRNPQFRKSYFGYFQGLWKIAKD